MGWSTNSYLNILWPDDDETLTIALRLLYIKITETRNNFDKKGAMRMVEFAWRSDLLIESPFIEKPFISSVRISVNNRDVIIYLS